MAKKSALFIILLTIPFGFLFSKAPKKSSLDALYHAGQRYFYSGNFNKALPLLEQYVKRSKNEPFRQERLFWVINEIGRIYLRTNRDPEGAIRFFEKFKGDSRFNEAEQDDMESWISAAKDWKKLGKYPKKIKDANELYRLGERFYRSGKKKQKFPKDEAGDADFHIAGTYLVPFIVNNDDDKRIGQALLMMGEIRALTLWNDRLYMVQNHYLGEVIRRFPHTDLAQRAYQVLHDEVHAGYSGSGGDFTPASWAKTLSRYKKLSQPRKKTKLLKKKG